MQLHLSTVVGCLVRCCCVPFLLCFFFFFLLQSVVGIFLWLFGAVFLVSVLLSDFFGFWLVWVFMCCCIFFCVFGFFFERTQLVFNTMLFVLFLYHFSLHK